MKLSKIALACTMAFTAMSAHAVSTGIPATPDNVVFIAGASGIDSYLGAAVSNLLNVTSYVHDSSSNNYQAWYGTTKAIIGGLPAGRNLLIIKRSKGGSANGVIPLAKSAKIEVPNWSDAAATLESTGKYIVSTTTAVNGLIPDIGVSDVEPKMFSGINAEFGFTALTSAQQGLLTSSAWSQLAEGIAVTKAVPDTYVLSNNFMREALTGHYKTWAPVDSASSEPIIICRRIEGSGTQAAFNSYFNAYPNVAAYNGYAKVLPAITSDSLGYDDAHAGTSADPILIDPNGYMVFEGSASSDVRKCLQAAQMGKDVTLVGREGKYYTLQFSAVGTPSKAIGVLSLDSYTSVSTTAKRDAAIDGIDGLGYGVDNTYVATNADGSTSGTTTGIVAGNGEWNFRFLNGNGVYNVKDQLVTTVGGASASTGIAPSRTNILNSSYDFTVEPTLQYRTAGTSAFVVGFYNTLKAVLGNPVDMEIGSANNGAPLAYAALPELYTKTTTGSTRLVSDLTRQGNTTAPLHVKQ